MNRHFPYVANPAATVGRTVAGVVDVTGACPWRTMTNCRVPVAGRAGASGCCCVVGVVGVTVTGAGDWVAG